MIAEAQRDPPDTSKWRTWAAYLAIAASEHDCEALVWVVALREATARACRATVFRVGPGCEMTVTVTGPGDLTSGPPAGLGAPEWAVLAAATGAVDLTQRAGQVRVLDALAAADAADLPRYNRLLMAVAPERAVAGLEELMAIAFRETLVDRLLAQGRAEGEAKGKANLLLRVLAARGIDVPAEARDRIQACTDTSLLDAWAERAANATALHEVFGDWLSNNT